MARAEQVAAAATRTKHLEAEVGVSGEEETWLPPGRLKVAELLEEVDGQGAKRALPGSSKQRAHLKSQVARRARPWVLPLPTSLALMQLQESGEASCGGRGQGSGQAQGSHPAPYSAFPGTQALALPGSGGLRTTGLSAEVTRMASMEESLGWVARWAELDISGHQRGSADTELSLRRGCPAQLMATNGQWRHPSETSSQAAPMPASPGRAWLLWQR